MSASGYSFVPGPGLQVLDQQVDPITLDYIRTATGEWTEATDGRSTVLLMLELELGASPFTPRDGTTIHAALRSGDPLPPSDVREETIRAMAILQDAGVLSELLVSVTDANGDTLLDQSGRLLVKTEWRDLASGEASGLIFQPR